MPKFFFQEYENVGAIFFNGGLKNGLFLLPAIAYNGDLMGLAGGQRNLSAAILLNEKRICETTLQH
jgi:hypothetical protein